MANEERSAAAILQLQAVGTLARIVVAAGGKLPAADLPGLHAVVGAEPARGGEIVLQDSLIVGGARTLLAGWWRRIVEHEP